nr:unnamed protein product [Spirometra erinaceieuropaei]
MRIHESGIDRNLDTPTPPSPNPNSSPCAPTNHSSTDIDATDSTTPHSSPSSSSSSFTATTTATPASVAHDFTTAAPATTTGTAPTSYIVRGEGQDYICPHCYRTFTSRIGLVGHLRIHRTETGEPVPGTPTYTHRTRLHCPHCPCTFMHRMVYSTTCASTRVEMTTIPTYPPNPAHPPRPVPPSLHPPAPPPPPPPPPL